MFGYLFHEDGKITKKTLKVKHGDDIKPEILGPEYSKEESLYCAGFSSYDDDDGGEESSPSPCEYFLYMHEDNDFPSNYEKSKLAINQALVKYFPNNPYKGNAILVKLEADGDAIVAGEWSHQVLREYKMGYSDTSYDVNIPLMVTKKDYRMMKLTPSPPPRPKPKPMPTKGICKECGKPKEVMFHYEICLINQTNTIIDRITAIRKAYPDIDKKIKKRSSEIPIDWEILTKFENLLKKGFDIVCIRWCNFYLNIIEGQVDREDTYENLLNLEVILDGLMSVAYCVDVNSSMVLNAKECPYCGNEEEECYDSRLRETEAIIDHLQSGGYEHSSLDSIKIFPHLTINIYNQFFDALKSYKENSEVTEPTIVMEISNWTTGLCDNFRFQTLLGEVDHELFG